MTRASHPLRGGLLVTAASLMFAAMGVTVRILSTELHNETIVFYRNLFGLLLLIPLLVQQGMPNLRTRRLPLHILRSLTGLSAMYCFFYAISQLHLSVAVLLNFSAPLFIPFIAALWLKELTGRTLVIAILVGFVGIMLILKPGTAVFSTAAAIGLASGFFAALAMVSLRRVTSTEPTTRVVFYYGVTCTLVSALPYGLNPQALTLGQIGLMLATGGFATAGQLLLTRGYAQAPAPQIGPFTYMAVVFATLFGWLFWGELPDAISAVGMGLVILAGILAMRAGGLPPVAQRL